MLSRHARTLLFRAFRIWIPGLFRVSCFGFRISSPFASCDRNPNCTLAGRSASAKPAAIMAVPMGVPQPTG